MANFCRNCGFSMSGGGVFCPQCGTQQTGPVNAGAAAVPPAAPVGPPPVPATKSGTGLKIFLVVLVVLAVGLVGIIGALFYVGHKVKQAVVAKAESYGVDLHSSASSESSASIAKMQRVCDLLSKEEASRLLGEPIDHVENRSGACLYYGPSGLTTKLAKEANSDTFKRSQAPGNSVTGAEVATNVTNLVNSLAADAGKGADGANEMPLLNLSLTLTDGKPRMAAMRISKRLLANMPDASAEIPNLGDRALRVGNLGLNVLKGDALIDVIVASMPDAHQKEIDVARQVLPRI